MDDPANRTSGSPSAASVGRPQLLAFSEDRTLWLLHLPDGRAVVRKVFERGSSAEAEAEAHLGTLLRGPGFVTYLAAEPDPDTGRPCTLTEHVPARDLARLVEFAGPLPPPAVAALGIALCRALRRLHTVAVHRDVKPSNILVHLQGDELPAITLLDAEHVWLAHAAAPRPGTFTGGTHGFSPPEAYSGAAPTPAFDVFGLGATLWFAATGWPPSRESQTGGGALLDLRRRRLEGLPPALVAALLHSLARDPRQRCTLAQLEAALEACHAASTTPGSRALDVAFGAMQRGELDAAERALAEVQADAEPALAARRDALRAALRRRSRLLARRPLPSFDEGQDHDALAARARTLHAFALRLPGHAGLRQGIARLREAVATAVERLPAAIAAHKRTAQFAAAHRELAAAKSALAAVVPLGGAVTRLPDGVAPNAMQRTPHRLLSLTHDDLVPAERRHEALLAELQQAESGLDVSGAAQAIDHAAGIYGGASEVVANLKDRLHRLTFYVERMAQPSEVLTALANELAASAGAVDLAPVEQCLDRCRRQSHGSRTPRSAIGLRALLRTLRELGDELPATSATLAPATTALASALDHVSQRAWATADDCHAKLAAVPIPVRPLQNQIARLDHLRLIDALIDTARGTRAELLDELERLRSDVDQARTTRDRIASGAREAMERGHLTTALYDMARVVDRYDAPAAELEEARKRKYAVEEAVRENHRLAAQYAALEDDPASDVEERIGVLEQRQRLLAFLSNHVAAERATTYAQDRLDVEIHMLRERTAAAEQRLDTLADPVARRELTGATLLAVNEFVLAHGDERDRLGRVQRMREHWESLAARSRHELSFAEATQRESWRRRRRSRLVRGLLVTLAGALAVTLYLLLRGRS